MKIEYDNDKLAKDIFTYLRQQIENDAARIHFEGRFPRAQIESAIEKARLLGMLDPTPFDVQLARLLGIIS